LLVWFCRQHSKGIPSADFSARGEIALLDNEPRSANVVAVGEVTLFRLTYDNFLDLQEKKPNVANKLILNMALNLSTRLRLSTEEINVLAEN